MDTRGMNKTKSVRFDKSTISKFTDTAPVRDSSAISIQNSSSSSSWYNKIAVRSDSSDFSDEDDKPQEQLQAAASTNSMQDSQHSLRRFITSEDRQKELKKELRSSLAQTKKERRTEESSKQIVGMISSKVFYNNGGNQEDTSGIETSIGGIRLDEKTLLEEAFINFHDLVRKHRLKISTALLQSELTSRSPPIAIAMKIGMSDQTYDELKLKRGNSWRGFVRREDMHAVLRRFGFFDTVSVPVFDRFAEKIKCYEKRFEKDWIHYTKLLAGAYRYKSSMSHLTKKFLMIDNKDGTKRVQSFRRFDEKLAVETISNGYKSYMTLVKLKEEKRKAEEQLKAQKKKEVPPTEKDKLRASMNESADHLILILREKVSQSQRTIKDIFRMLDSDGDQFISKEEFVLAFKKADILVDDTILEQAYNRFDFNKDDKVSFNEFLNLIFAQEKNKPISSQHLKSQVTELVTEIRKVMLSRFNNRSQFQQALTTRNPNKISEDEFCNFLATHTSKEQEITGC